MNKKVLPAFRGKQIFKRDSKNDKFTKKKIIDKNKAGTSLNLKILCLKYSLYLVIKTILITLVYLNKI